MSGLRIDLYQDRRARLRELAEEMLRTENTHLVLFADELASEMRVWSPPVQLMVEPNEDGTLSVIVRRV